MRRCANVVYLQMDMKMPNRAVAGYMGERDMLGNAVDAQSIKLLRERLLKILKKRLVQLQSNDVLCLQKDGGRLLDKQNFCAYCGTKLPADAAFCPGCGKPTQAEASEALPAPVEQQTEKEKLFYFRCGKQYATISVDSTTVRIGQHSDWIFRHGERFDQFDVMEINSITREKKLSLGAVLQTIPPISLIVLSVVFLCAGEWILATIFGVSLFFGIDSDCIINPMVARTTIHHRRGKVQFYDRSDGTAIWDFLDYVNQYNPGCVRVRPPFPM